MAMTPEERSTYALCGATKKDRTECRAFAGQGTDHPGVGACKYHGGATPSHKTHAAKVEAQREMATYGDQLEIKPLQALKAVLGLTAGHVAWLKARIAVLDSLESPEGQSLMRLYGEERDRLTRVGKACLDSGMKQIELEASEQQTSMMGELLEAVLCELDLTPEQRKQVGPAIRKTLPAVTGSVDTEAAVDPVVDAVLV